MSQSGMAQATVSRMSMIAGKQLTATHDASSSSFPASPDEGAGAACSDNVVHGGRAPASLNSPSAVLESTTSQPYPQPPISQKSNPLNTPLQEDRSDLTLCFAGTAFPSSDLSLPTPPILKAGHNLRLPSFDLLGIAAPHPDRYSLPNNHSFSPLGAGPLSKPEDPLHDLSPELSRPRAFGGVGEEKLPSPEASRRHLEQILPTVTPPTEPGTVNWGTFVKVKTAGVGSPPSSDPGVSPNIQVTSSHPSSSHTIVPTFTQFNDTLGMASWIERTKELLTADLASTELRSVKVLSHALPCPSLTGHIFGEIIATIHDRTSTPTAWVNVFHAVPGRYTLAEVPKSPPSTPGPAVGGDEYFTSKVFESAVAVPDYQLESRLLPPSPRPVVAPGSVNVSVVERYIPPTNVNEFSEMFALKGHSLLFDRLLELSHEPGSLLFIYPTKTGAKTFMNHYLGPVLDPLIRSMAVTHDLSADFGINLGQMAAVDRLFEYEFLLAETERFLGKVSETIANSSTVARGQYRLIHAAREEVVLDRKTWADDWWIKQEKPRVRDVVTKYFRKAKKLSDESEVTPTNLIQDVLEGVSKREYKEPTPMKGIEVGVFMIKKIKDSE